MHSTTVDAPIARDIGNSNPNVLDGNKVGPTLAASGAGAERAVSVYSKDTQPGDANTQAYTQLAKEFSLFAQETTKSLTAMAGLLSEMIVGKSFPVEDLTEERRKESKSDQHVADGPVDDDDDDEPSLEKGTSVVKLMAYLGKQSRKSSIARPPDMSPRRHCGEVQPGP